MMKSWKGWDGPVAKSIIEDILLRVCMRDMKINSSCNGSLYLLKTFELGNKRIPKPLKSKAYCLFAVTPKQNLKLFFI